MKLIDYEAESIRLRAALEAIRDGHTSVFGVCRYCETEDEETHDADCPYIIAWDALRSPPAPAPAVGEGTP